MVCVEVNPMDVGRHPGRMADHITQVEVLVNGS